MSNNFTNNEKNFSIQDNYNQSKSKYLNRLYNTLEKDKEMTYMWFICKYFKKYN